MIIIIIFAVCRYQTWPDRPFRENDFRPEPESWEKRLTTRLNRCKATTKSSWLRFVTVYDREFGSIESTAKSRTARTSKYLETDFRTRSNFTTRLCYWTSTYWQAKHEKNFQKSCQHVHTSSITIWSKVSWTADFSVKKPIIRCSFSLIFSRYKNSPFKILSFKICRLGFRCKGVVVQVSDVQDVLFLSFSTKRHARRKFWWNFPSYRFNVPAWNTILS